MLEVYTIIKVTIYTPDQVYDANERLRTEIPIMYDEFHAWAGSFTGRYQYDEPVINKIFNIIEKHGDAETEICLLHNYIIFEIDNAKKLEIIKTQLWNYFKRLKEVKETL